MAFENRKLGEIIRNTKRKPFDYIIGVTATLAAIASVIIGLVAYNNTQQIDALKNIDTSEQGLQRSAQTQLVKLDNSLTALNKILEKSTRSDSSLNNIAIETEKQLQNNESLLKTNNNSLNELSNAVNAIILSDTQLVNINNRLQTQTDSLMKQTRLLSKSIDVNNEILLINKHRDTAQFITASYELEKLLIKIDTANYRFVYRSDSLTLLNCIDSLNKFFLQGLENYCVNDDSKLFTAWEFSLQTLHNLQKVVEKAYPDKKEIEEMGNQFPGNWADQVQTLMDDGRKFDANLTKIKAILKAVKDGYFNSVYIYSLQP